MRHKIAAIVVHKNNVLSVGYNRPFGDIPHEGTWSIHAEIDAVTKAFKVYPEYRLDGDLILYVARKGNKNAKPCEDCQKFLFDHRVREVYFSTGSKARGD
jgi:deoxycytidylate deaminase